MYITGFTLSLKNYIFLKYNFRLQINMQHKMYFIYLNYTQIYIL